MLIYNYHPETQAYLGSETADQSPLEPGVYLIPKHATATAPPDAPEGYKAAFIDGEWTLKQDQLGRVYWLADGSRHVVTSLSDVVPDGALDEPPDLRTEAQILAEALDYVNAVHARLIGVLVEGATEAERDTWIVKEREAQSVIDGGTSTMLAAEATARGVTVLELAQTITSKAAQYKAHVGTAGALRGGARKALQDIASGDGYAAAVSAVLADFTADVQEAIDT